MFGISTRWCGAGLAACLLGGAFAGADLYGEPAPATTPSGEAEVSWVLLGTAQRGSQLVLGDVTNLSTCSDPTAEVVSATDREVRVRVVHVTRPGNPYGCETPSNFEPATPLYVPLGGPLNGRAVVGNGKLDLTRKRNRIPTIDDHRKVWLVLGLSATDAVATLRGIGYKRAHLRVVGGTDGAVVRTEPKLPLVFRRSKSVRIVMR